MLTHLHGDGRLTRMEFLTVASLIAQWLMARKKLESWLFWIAVDVAAIGIYWSWSKGLLLTSGLYAAFLVLAIVGLFAWRGSLADLRAERCAT